MSLFIGQLAFAGQPETSEIAKMAILAASLAAAALGMAFLAVRGRAETPD